jgi:hypothetical protein
MVQNSEMNERSMMADPRIKNMEDSCTIRGLA